MSIVFVTTVAPSSPAPALSSLMVDGYTCTAITGRTTTPNKSTSAQLHGHELAEHAGELGDTGCNQKKSFY